MDLSSSTLGGVVTAVVVGGVAAYYVFRGRKKRTVDDSLSAGDSRYSNEEVKRKRLARLRKPQVDNMAQNSSIITTTKLLSSKPTLILQEHEGQAAKHEKSGDSNDATVEDKISSPTAVPEEKERSSSSPPNNRFLLKTCDDDPLISLDSSCENYTEVSSLGRDCSSNLRKRMSSAKNMVEKLLFSLLVERKLTPNITQIDICSAAQMSSCEVTKNRLMIKIHDFEGKDDMVVALEHCLDSLRSPHHDPFAQNILKCSLPAVNRSCFQNSFSELKSNLKWLSRVHSICDPLSDFSHQVERIFECESLPTSNNSSIDLIGLGKRFVNEFRSASISLAKTLMTPYEQEASEGSTFNNSMEDSELPPLFADEVVETPQKDVCVNNNCIGSVIFDSVRQKDITGGFFCEVMTDFSSLLHKFHACAMNEIRKATTDPNNVFLRADCDLFATFPMFSLDVLLITAPAMGKLLIQNILHCEKWYAGDGMDFMNAFLLSDLFSLTNALSMPPVLTLNPSSNATVWMKLMQAKDKNILISSRISDIDRIIGHTRLVTFEIFKCAATTNNGRHKKDIMVFLSHLLDLAAKRTLGRGDDRSEIMRNFEPEGKVLSRHFVYAAADLVTHLLAHGGIKIFNHETFLVKREKELADIALVRSLSSGMLCKCNLDVYLQFSALLFIGILDREELRQSFVLNEMTRVIKRSNLSVEQKDVLRDYQQAYNFSFSCQFNRPASNEQWGVVADTFCKYMVQMISSTYSSEFFGALESSPYNIYKSLSFVWKSLSRIRRPSATLVEYAERVVYLACLLLNKSDCLSDVKQQSHWVDILSAVGGNINNDDEEFDDECLQRNQSSTIGDNEPGWGVPKWKKKSTLVSKSADKSAYFGSSRSPYIGALFDSSRNVRELPVALAQLYITCQSVEDWDADRDRSFSKFTVRKKIGSLLITCLNHPLHSDAVLKSLLFFAFSDDFSLLVALFESAIDHNTSNVSFLVKVIEVATSAEEVKTDYYAVNFVRQGVQFIQELCREETILAENKILKKLGNHILQLFQIRELILNADAKLGLHGTIYVLEYHMKELTKKMTAVRGNDALQTIVDCCVSKGIRLCLNGDSTGLNELVASRWADEDAFLSQQQAMLVADKDADDVETLCAQVQADLGDDSFVSKYIDAVSDICNSVESVSDIPGFKFKKIAKESREKGTPRPVGVMKAWKQVRRCLKNANGKDSFHPNGTIVIKYLEADASCARAVISVNAETPYAFGLFFFDIWLPPDYPNIPPLCELMTTGDQSFMLSPNLYSCGKVCMSLLNSAPSSADIEKWQPGLSTVAQVLLTIQTSLLGDPEPMTKEGKARGSPLSLAYNEEKHFETVSWGMIDALKNGKERMGDEFGQFITCHFTLLKEQVRQTVRAWWIKGRKNKRIERVFLILLYELEKLSLMEKDVDEKQN